ncbi:MAG: MMPL family transporter [Kordiimonadaceae bacterium]|nr:MMPL family transporter [Kordiimonadaceae bacterium]
MRTMTATDRIAVTIATTVLKFRWLIILTTILATAAVSYGVQFLTFSSDYRDFFSKFNPELQAFESFQNTYTKNDNFFYVIVPKSGDVFNNTTLTLVEELTEEAWQIPYSQRVDSATNFQHTYAEDDDLIVENLIEGAVSLTAEQLEEKRAIVLNEPLLRNQLVAGDSRAIAVNVVVEYPKLKTNELLEAVIIVRSLRDRMKEKYPGHEIRITGVSMLDVAFAEAGMSDIQTTIPAMFLILLVLMMLIFRSVSGTLVTMMMIFFASAIGMGVGGFASVSLTPISLSAPTIIMTLAIADSVHILVSLRHAMKSGMDKQAAIVEAIRINFLAIMVTSVTTAIGFLALNFYDSPPFWHLGNISAVGVVAAWIMSITFLPAMMSWMPFSAPKQKDENRDNGFYAKLADFVVNHNKKLFYGLGAAALLLVMAIPRIEFNDQWTEYFDTRIEFRRDVDFSDDYFGFQPIEYSVLSSGEGGVSDPEYLQTLDAFAVWLRMQPNVAHVYSISDIMKRLNKNMHEDKDEWFRLPESRELAAQYLLLYEISLPYGLDLNDRINIDKSASRLTVTLNSVTTTETNLLLDASAKWLRENGPDYMQATVPTGAHVMFSYIAERNVKHMITGNLLSVFAIGLVMIFALKSVQLGILSVVPNGIPILVAFGVWALLVGTVGFSIAAVASVSLGIVVDDTVHFLTKYMRGLRECNHDRARAIRYAFETVGSALVVNTVILVIGFSYLATSNFKVNADMGLLTALAIAFALLFDFLFLPALMLQGSGKISGLNLNDSEGNIHVSK